MVRTESAIKLPAVGRARCATGLNARSQMGQSHRFFASHLGLNARIEEWNAGLLDLRPTTANATGTIPRGATSM